ncbi:DUF234 domain-containing protein [Phytoactinopolyspora halotolerans]|uniref:DUF234 domain-containing protein n=1 Tax=Phytoactinopolyspora halotolerans TaxID=1981512 RepID=UPI0028AD619B|nr:DUF234 domain-containing protein [Phytoactinopolyspora halotolerans]
MQRSWESWRGRAIEPVVRDAVLRIAPELGWPDVEQVGGWWNRQNNPEVDLIGADRPEVARRVVFAGSIKWHETKRFDDHDHHMLVREATAVPGFDENTDLVAVSRGGFAPSLPVRQIGPTDLVEAWQQ